VTRWTYETVKALHESKKSLGELGIEHGVSRQRMGEVFKQFGFKPSAKGGRPPKKVEPLLLNIGEAAELLGVSRDFFDDHIRDELRVIRRGLLIRIPRSELVRWVEESSQPSRELGMLSRSYRGGNNHGT